MIRNFTLAFLTILSLGIKAQESEFVIWNDDKSASASCSEEELPTCRVIINGTSVDVSQVTYANLGKLGIANLDEYKKVVTMPDEWIKSTSDIQVVNFKTHAWRNGQRYTVNEPVLVKNGKYFVR